MTVIGLSNGGNMELKQLHYFVTVVEEGTISAAAKKLFISQPPLSTQIKLLEKELGCILFKRGQRQIQLTEAGKLLYAKACILLEISRVTKEEIQECADAEAGTIRIGIVSSIVSPMTEWIASYSILHPEIRFSIYEGNTYDLIEKLRSKILHIAMIRTPYAADDITAESLMSESLVTIGQAHFFKEEGQRIMLEELAKLPIILYRRWESIIKKEFSKSELSFHYKCMCDDARTVVDLVEQGVGVGLVPASAIKQITDSQVVHKILESCSIESKIDLIYYENAYLPSWVKEFQEYLRVQWKGIPRK